MAYCIFGTTAKQNLDQKAITHILTKDYASIVFSANEMLDGTHFYTVGNIKDRNIR
jgi:hypothetical protein